MIFDSFYVLFGVTEGNSIDRFLYTNITMPRAVGKEGFMRKLQLKRKRIRAIGTALALAVSTLTEMGVTASKEVRAATDYGLSNPTISDGVTTWDCVWFGNYWQNDTNGDGTADQNDKKQPIKWRVLSVNGDDAFLLADQCLDCQPYNKEYINVTWETCTLRTWLNQDFYSAAFSSAEQSAVKTTAVVNEDNPYYDTEGGNNTTDKVYLLSLSEVTSSVYGLFSTDSTGCDKARYGKSTEYAKNQGAWVSTAKDYAGNSWWWLRSPGRGSKDGISVSSDGYVNYGGNYVDDDTNGVRPALHLNLSSSVWKKGEIVMSEDKKTETQPSGNDSESGSSDNGKKVEEGGNSGTSTNSGSDTTASASSTDGTTVNRPAKVKLLKVTNKKKGKTVVSFKRVSGAKGYQIQYAKNKKFTKGKKSKFTKKAKYTVKKLKKKKTYYFRVRAYKIVNGTKKYGKWSVVKKLKIKK